MINRSIKRIKDLFFFPIASYFKFWAMIRFKKWSPRVIVITGSSGKTTLFKMVESQLDDIAHYSHHANSAIGVPFDILGLHRITLKPGEWFGLFLQAPLNAFKKPYKEKIYVVECDADRPNEGKFLAEFLKPEVTLWVSSSRTHSMNFEKDVPRKFKSVEEAVAYEFGYFLKNTSKLAVIDGDNKNIERQTKRTQANVRRVKIKELKDYSVDRKGTKFMIGKQEFVFNQILPREIFYSIQMADILCKYLGVKFDPKFQQLELPPARSSIFKGIKGITIIDSTYNANLSSMTAILSMFFEFPVRRKWLVIGDMLEQGKLERDEHEKLAGLLLAIPVERIVLLGPRVKKYTYPILKENSEIPIAVFENPRKVLDYLKENIEGGETILFKGARFLEGVIENLLEDKSEAKYLARREKVWEERRVTWGF